MISELKERLTAVEGEIEELKKELPTNPPPLAPGTFLIDSELRFWSPRWLEPSLTRMRH